MSRSLIAALAGATLIPAFATTALADPNPDPEAQTTTSVNGTVLETRVYFEFDKAELNDAARSELDEAAQWLKKHPEAMLIIEGHTDKVGDLAYNRRLSDSRAEATRLYLLSAGIEADRIKLLPYGESLPVVDVNDKSRANRRIHIYSVSSEPIMKERIVAVPAPLTVTNTEYVPVETTVVREVPTRRPMHFAVSAGGGVMHSLLSETREVTDVGGTWNVRVAAGTQRMIGAEIAYVGTAQDIDNEMGLGDDARLVSNGAEGAARINLPGSALSPYLFAGVGLMHYDVVNADNDADIDDNVVFVPAGIGLGYHTSGLLIDVRGTARAAFDDEALDQMSADGETDLANWSATAQLGWEF